MLLEALMWWRVAPPGRALALAPAAAAAAAAAVGPRPYVGPTLRERRRALRLDSWSELNSDRSSRGRAAVACTRGGCCAYT